MTVLQDCAARTRGLKGPEAAAFNEQIKGLGDFLGLADTSSPRFPLPSKAKSSRGRCGS